MKQFFVVALLILFSSCTNNYKTVIIPNDANSQKEAEEDPDIDDWTDEILTESEEDDEIIDEVYDDDLSDEVLTESEVDDETDSADEDTELPDNDFNYPPSETSPIDLEGIDAYYYSDISYGEDTANRIDLFAAKSESPTPVVIFIHGGGFTAGDKSEAYGAGGPFVIRELLAQGISFVSVNYRLLEQNDTVGIIKPLGDCRTAVQFVRYISDLYNFDKTKVGLYGFSAGAGASMWIGFQEDAADPQNSDPILRESTRVKAVGALETQATYDLVRWETEILKPFDITLQLAANFGMRNLILSFYGISSMDELYTPETEAYRQKVDMLDLISFDDPEMYVSNAYNNAGKPTDLYGVLHHPNHAKAVMDKAQEVGASGIFYIDALGISEESGEQLTHYLIRKLK